MGLNRRVAMVVALVATLGVAIRLRVRQQQQHWWTRVEALCACSEPTLARIIELQPAATAGLDRALVGQRRTLIATCDDMRAAMTRHSWTRLLRGQSVRVTPSSAHQRARRDTAFALGLLCGTEHQQFWSALRERIHTDATAGDAQARAVLHLAREHLQVRDAMCERRVALTQPAHEYEMSKISADAEIQMCREAR
jgi:hypothetical protein